MLLAKSGHQCVLTFRMNALSIPHITMLTLSQHSRGLKGDSFKEITHTVHAPPSPFFSKVVGSHRDSFRCKLDAYLVTDTFCVTVWTLQSVLSPLMFIHK